jgi:CubicO group peptidase (beta-lactamase class C family)
MKKIIVTVAIVALLSFAFANGITPAYVTSAPGVASGIGAKLLCSGRYISGFSEQQALDDLVKYSPLLDYLSVEFDDSTEQVTTSFLGLATTTATHVDGIGCYADYEGFDQRADYADEDRVPMPVFSSRWPHGTRVETIDPAIQSQLDALIAADNAEGLDTRALLIVHNGQIIAESYAGEADAETPLLGWSMAKSLMAIMLGNLEYRGLLDPTAKPVVAQWAEDERANIELTDLLTMTDGLAFSEAYNPGDDATAMLFTEASGSDYAISRPVAQRPGTQFNYSSGTANILSRVYFNHTGATLADSLADYREHIATPLSFQHAVFEPDAAGVLVGSSYFYASARDWARIGQMMLNGGVLNGHRIVSEDWVDRATSPNGSRNNRAYGYQFWLNRGNADQRWPDLPADAYAANGNREQSVTVLPSQDLVVVRLGWTTGRYPINDRIVQIMGWFSAQ